MMTSITCPECKNEKELDPQAVEVGRWFECDHCGVSFEITKIGVDGKPEIKIIEEEK